MQNVRVNDDGGLTPHAAEVREQVRKIRESVEFQAPERARRFLEFIVEETLLGRGNYLKAYTIAQEVFGRNSAFDAQNDPVVRIEAGRIRRALERYYLVAGQADAVEITIPKGGYVPSFRYAQSPTIIDASDLHLGEMPGSSDKAADQPAPTGKSVLPDTLALMRYLVLVAATALLTLLAVTNFSDLSPKKAPPKALRPMVYVETFEQVAAGGAFPDIARGFTDEVIGQLAKLKNIMVVTRPPSGGAAGSKEGGKPPGFTLQGRFRVEGDRLRLTVRLVNVADDTVVWANSYDRTLGAQNAVEIQMEVAQSIAMAIVEPYGAIVRNPAEFAHAAPDEWTSYACTLSYYSYRLAPDPRDHSAVRECLEKATATAPTQATIWALLSLTYLDELRYRYKLKLASTDVSLALAGKAADRAIELDPQNVRALQALMLVKFSGDVDDALKIGATAYSLNPNDMELAGEYGLRLALAGQWDAGCEMISNIMDRSSGPKGYFEIGLAMCAFMRGDYAKAEAWARRSDLEYNPMHHLVLMAALGAQAKREQAGEEMSWIEANAPDLLTNVRREIDLRVQLPDDQERFYSGLRLAGLTIH